MGSEIRVRLADLASAEDEARIVRLTNEYARDPMGRGGDLPAEVLGRLVPAMREHGGIEVLLAFSESEAVGICTCIRSFSTFAAAPVLNVHDLAVVPAARGLGVGRALLQAALDHGAASGCNKLTLEVLQGNLPARRLYGSMGFRGASSSDEVVRFCGRDCVPD